MIGFFRVLFLMGIVTHLCCQERPRTQLVNPPEPKGRAVMRWSTSRITDVVDDVSQEEFTDEKLIPHFRQFAETECSRNTLSRLTVGVGNLPFIFYLPNSNQGYRNLADIPETPRRAMIAEMMCDSTSAIATIRHGTNLIRSLQIRGNGNPYVRRVGGRDVRFRFSLDVPSDDKRSLSKTPTIDQISFFVEANPLLQISEAASLLEDMTHWVGVSNATLIVRADTLFGNQGGPILDIVSLKYPDVPYSLYHQVPSIRCAIGTYGAIPRPRNPARPECWTIYPADSRASH